MSQTITFDLSKADATSFFNALGAALTDSSGPSSTKGANAGKVKRQNSNKGKPTCHGDFVKMICEKLKEEVATFKKEHPEQKGAHLVFAANYKKEHAEEFAAFEAAWKEAHPKDAVSDAGSVSSKPTGSTDGNSDAEASPVKEKPKRVISDEQKAKMKAGREAAAAKKKAEASVPSEKAPEAPVASEAPVTTQKKPVKTAKKASPAEITVPVVAPITEANAIASELIPFAFNGSTYLRMGVKLPNGDARFTSAHLWMSKKGAKGPHYGEIREDGTIDMEAEEPVA